LCSTAAVPIQSTGKWRNCATVILCDHFFFKQNICCYNNGQVWEKGLLIRSLKMCFWCAESICMYYLTSGLFAMNFNMKIAWACYSSAMLFTYSSLQ
jgi:hypothetical protein